MIKRIDSAKHEADQRLFADRLCRELGVKGALAACRHNLWYGVEAIIEANIDFFGTGERAAKGPGRPALVA